MPNCAVHGCQIGTDYCGDKHPLHRFPKTCSAKKQWMLCSKHFVMALKPDAVPILDFATEKHPNFLVDHTYCANILSDRSKQDTNPTRNLLVDGNVGTLRFLKSLKITKTETLTPKEEDKEVLDISSMLDVKIETPSTSHQSSPIHVENSSEISPKVFMSEEDLLVDVNVGTLRSLKSLKITKITQKRKKLFVSFGSNENLPPPSMPILKPFPELPAEETSTCLPKEVLDVDLEELEELDEEEEALDPLDVKIERPSISHQSSPIHMENSSETWNGLDNVKNSESDDLDLRFKELDNEISLNPIFVKFYNDVDEIKETKSEHCHEKSLRSKKYRKQRRSKAKTKTETKESMDKDDEWKGARYANRSIENRNRRKNIEEKRIADRVARNAKTSSKFDMADTEQNNNVIRKSVRIKRPKTFHFESKRTDNINMEPTESIKEDDDGFATFMDCHQEIKTEIEIKEEPLYDQSI